MRAIPLKLKRSVRIVILLVLLIAGGRLAVVLSLSTSSIHGAPSPDGRRTAHVKIRWQSDFWGRTGHEYHDIKVTTADGLVLRQFRIDQPWLGWPYSGSINWAADSSSVTIGFNGDNFEKGHLVISVRK